MPAYTFGQTYNSGVKYIKINRYDSGGLDRSDYLSQLQSLTLTYPDRSAIEYPITTIQEQANFYLYGITPGYNTSSKGNINDYSWFIQSSSAFTLSVFPGATLTNTSLISGNSLGYFNTTTGNWNFGDTPNKIIQVQISGNVTWGVPANGPIVTIYDNISGDVIQNENLTGVTGPQTNYPFNVTLILSSSYYSPIENNSISFKFGKPGAGTYTINNLWISTSLHNSSPFNGSSSLVIFNPDALNFDYNNYNPLLDNAEIPQYSTTWMDIDYSQNPLTPVNFGLIISGTADRAFVQDSNYSSKAWSNLRYNGSRTNSFIKI